MLTTLLLKTSKSPAFTSGLRVVQVLQFDLLYVTGGLLSRKYFRLHSTVSPEAYTVF